MPPRSSSAGLRSIRRELQRRRAKLLAPTRPAAKKPSAPLPLPPSREHKGWEQPRPRPPGEQDPSSTTTSQSRGSAGSHTPPPPPPPPQPRHHAPPRPSSVASPPTLPPWQSRASSAGSAPSAAACLKPGTPVGVRTRSLMVDKVTGKTIVLWLRATVVSATDDGGYDVVYEGKLPHGDPYVTVRVPRHHVRARQQTPSTTTTPPPSSAASSYASPTTTPAAACKSLEMQPAPRPTTAGKSIRLISNLAPEMERQARAIFQGY